MKGNIWNMENNMSKISVDLYGGRETPSRAEEVFCDKYKKCSLFKNNCCLNVTAPFSCKCKFGKVNVIKGYTSRAKKYYEFKEKYEKDEMYGKLKYPSNYIIGLIDDYIYLDLTYVKVYYKNNKYYIDTINFGNSNCWVELEKFNCDLLYEIANYKSYAMMGGEIKTYQTQCVPHMLQQLKKLLPKLYNEFIEKYPQFNIKPNYIGKYAYIKTLVKNSVLIDQNGNKFIFDGENLICKNWNSYLPFNGDMADIKIKVNDKMKYKIDNNSQVDENTKFE